MTGNKYVHCFGKCTAVEINAGVIQFT